MHEMALAEGILAVVLDAAGSERVRRVQIDAGRLQAIVPESLKFSFQLLAEDSSAADAILELKEIPLRMRCRNCGEESEYDFPPSFCSRCKASQFHLVSGDELNVNSVELENGLVLNRPSEDVQEALQEQLREHVRHEHLRGDS
jgi:hydrogenase nickel incorporation protein HypA/HybF